MLSTVSIFVIEQYLLGNIKTLPNNFFPKEAGAQEEMALDIIRFVVERYMYWTPEIAYNKIDKKTLEHLKIDFLCKHIEFPPEANQKNDFYIIIQKLYPDIVESNFVENTIAVYKKVLNGTLLRFPKTFFEGIDGENKAILCLRYALNHNLVFHSNDAIERYSFFGSKAGTQFIRNAKLSLPLKTMFDNAVDYYHQSTAPHERSKYACMYATCRAL